MLTEKQMETALKLFEKRMQGVTDFYYQRMGEHIRDIGQLAPSDVHRLQQLRRVDKTMAEVKQRLARAAGMSVKDIEKVLEQAARVDDRVVRKITGVDDADVRLASNTALRRALRAQAAETAGLMKNLSKTTATPKAYQKAVDAAVTAVQSGAEDYESAIRRTLRQAGALGLRVRDTGTSAVEYESGHTRRVDTAVRMNILDAMRRMNQRAMEEVGREFGADGVEIDAHMLCAEDHLPYQGQQYTNEEFEEIQESLPRPFGEWNCRHTWAPIIVGVSPRAYTDEDLARFERYSTEEVEIDGRTKTRYEWSQEMRRMETAIRQKKDTATLAAAAGDATLRRECQGSINAMVKAYERVSDLAGMGPDFRRTYVAGFRDVKVLTSNSNGGTINTKLNASNNVMNPMDANRFYRMRDSLQKQGVSVIQADGDDLRYLRALGAEASYGNGYIMHQGKIPSASAMFEEIIHMKQARVYGEFADNNPVELAARECAAQHKLLINGKAYGFTEQDFNDIRINGRKWTERFHSLTGKEYDPNDRGSQYYRGI